MPDRAFPPTWVGGRENDLLGIVSSAGRTQYRGLDRRNTPAHLAKQRRQEPFHQPSLNRTSDSACAGGGRRTK